MKKIFILPDLKAILDNKEMWKPGSMVTKEGRKKRFMSQSTIPSDDLILEKLGIQKGETVLSIASNHGDWARSIKDKGCIVDYSEISKYFINYVKKRIKFRNYLKKDFTNFPEKVNRYDWSFSYEPVGGRRGLPIAMMRSLLNRKGGIIVYYEECQPGKAKDWPRMIRALAKTYKTRYTIKSKSFEAFRHQADGLGTYKKADKRFKVFTLKTNDSAKKKVLEDIKILESLKNKNTTNKNLASLQRLNNLKALFVDKFTKEVTFQIKK